MAKKQTIVKGLFDKTEPQPGAKSEGKKTKDPQELHNARGVSLKNKEWQELETIARELGMNLHAISAYGLRYFIKQYKAGAIKAELKKTLTLPGL